MKKALDIRYKNMVTFLFSSYIMAQIHEEGNMEDLSEGIH